MNKLMSLLLLTLACSDGAATAPFLLTVDKETLEANGVDRATLTATVPGDSGELVVSFASTGGLLSSSAQRPMVGVATVMLLADREDALLGRAAKPVTVRATITRADQDVQSATVDLVFLAPTTGAPAVFITADPPAGLADGITVVRLTIQGRRLASGTSLSLTTTAGILSSAAVLLDEDGAATAILLAPSSPAEAVVVAREPGGAEGTTTVSFVADGEAQFDLTGTFAQFAPARVRMRAGTLAPNPQCITAPAYVKVDVVQTGAAIDAVYTTCFVTLAPVTSIVGEVTNVAPPAFIGAIPQVHALFSLASLALGAAWTPPHSVVVSGAELDDALEELPTNPEDPRVRDADSDGRPGVTVVNSLAGEQNITFRNIGATSGLVTSSNRILGTEVGSLSALPESSVLGAADAFLPEFQSVASVFELVRVDGKNGAPDMDTNGDETISCNEIVDAADFLFSVQTPATPLDCAGVP